LRILARLPRPFPELIHGALSHGIAHGYGRARASKLLGSQSGGALWGKPLTRVTRAKLGLKDVAYSSDINQRAEFDQEQPGCGARLLTG
jgi:hypothetical protein